MSVEPAIDTGGEAPAAPVGGAPAAEVTPEAGSPAPVANWRDGLSAEFSENPALADFKDLNGLAKSFIHQGKLVGADKIALPQDDWTEEQFNDFHAKLGRPATPEDYNLESFETPEGVEWDGAFQGEMVSEMHRLGLSQDQVLGVLNFYGAATGRQLEQAAGNIERSREEGLQALRTDWGSSFKAQADIALRTFKAGAGENFEAIAGMKLADGSELGAHPEIIKVFATLGGERTEHGLVGGHSERTTFSPKEAEGKVNALYADKEFLAAYTSKQHPEHAAAVEKMRVLTVMQIGDQPVSPG